MAQLNLVDESGKALPTGPAPALNLVDESGKALSGSTPDVSVKLDYGNGQTDSTDWLGSAVTFGKHFLSAANPVPVDLLKSIYERGNIETAKSILGAQGAQFDKAKDAFTKGDYLNAGRYTLGWLLPLIGPAANDAGDKLGRGEYAAGLGQAAGLAVQPLVGKAIGELGSAGKVAIASKLNPVEAGAVQFADREGIPLDVATRTGNKTAGAFQNVVAKQLGGAGVAADARLAQTQALQRTSENLRTQVEPNLGANDYTAETAGQGVRDALQSRANRFNSKANEAYQTLREIEQRPESQVNVADTPAARTERAYKAFKLMVDQSTEARLEAIHQEVRGGATEMVGKAKREYVNPDDPHDVGPITGRFAGGFKKSFSELAGIDAEPGEIAKAIDRGKGKLYEQVRDVVQKTVLEHEGDDIGRALRDMDLPADVQNVALPVDMRGVKAAVRPLYDELQQRWPLAKQQSSQGLKALENILNSKDVLSASEADANLSALKSLQREAKDSRNLALTSKAVRELDFAVRGAVAKAGPDAVQALDRGRALTRAKYSSLNLLDRLNDEPVKVFDQLTARRDTQLNLLRDVQRQAPQAMPQLGRAYLEGLFDSAKQDGGFGKTGTIANKWQALGDQSKQMLFKDPRLIKDLDNFFRISRKISENPNPSGTASTLAAVTGAGLVVTHPVTGLSYVLGSNVLARLLFNPRAAKALNEGFKIPIKAPGAGKTAAAAYLLKLAGEQGQQLQPQPAY